MIYFIGAVTAEAARVFYKTAINLTSRSVKCIFEGIEPMNAGLGFRHSAYVYSELPAGDTKVTVIFTKII
jgi:hypothetical protein